MKELDYQAALVKSAVAQGGFGKKLSHRMFVGIPDLLLQMPKTPTIILECKWVVWKPKSEWVQIDATPLQRKFLRDFTKCGGMGAISVGTKIGQNFFHVVTCNLDEERWRASLFVDHMMQAHSAGVWDVELLAEKIHHHYTGMGHVP